MTTQTALRFKSSNIAGNYETFEPLQDGTWRKQGTDEIYHAIKQSEREDYTEIGTDDSYENSEYIFYVAT